MDTAQIANKTGHTLDRIAETEFISALRVVCDAVHVGAELYSPDGRVLVSSAQVRTDGPYLWTVPAGIRVKAVARALEWSQPHLFDVAPGITEAVVPLYADDEYVGYICVGPVRAATVSPADSDGTLDLTEVSGAAGIPRMTIRQFRSFLDLVARAVEPCVHGLRPAPGAEPQPAEPLIHPSPGVRPVPRRSARRNDQLAGDMFTISRSGRVRQAVRIYARDRLGSTIFNERVRLQVLSDVLLVADRCTQAGVPTAEVSAWTNTATSDVGAAADRADVERAIGALMRCIRRSGRTASFLHSSRLRRIADYAERHIGQRLSAGDVSAALGLTQRQVVDTVKAQTGVNYRAFITTLRMVRARDLLERTQLGIAAIARRAGYVYESYFSRVFTGHVGEPPTRFRQRMKRKTTE